MPTIFPSLTVRIVFTVGLALLAPSLGFAGEDKAALPNLPPGWEGSCMPMGSHPHCMLWRDTTLGASGAFVRLIFFDYFSGGYAAGIGIPGDATAVVVMVESRTRPNQPRIMATDIQGLEALAFEVELLGASRLFVQLDFPIRQLVSIPMTGLQAAAESLHTTVEWWRHQPSENAHHGAGRVGVKAGPPPISAPGSKLPGGAR